MPMLFYIHGPGLLSYLFLLLVFAAAVFPPFIFLVFADYYFLLLLQARKIFVCVCMCVVKYRAEKSSESSFFCLLLCILNNFPYYIYFFTLLWKLLGRSIALQCMIYIKYFTLYICKKFILFYFIFVRDFNMWNQWKL